MRKNTVITISRQFGSGGRQISRLLAEKMGVKRYDQTVVAMAAESLGAGDQIEEVISRSYSVPEASLGAISTASFDRVPAYNQLYIEQGKIIRAIAAKGEGAVFLGRCADVVLAGQPDVYSFYTGKTWGDPLNFDLTINTSRVPLEKAADLILSYVEFCQAE